MFQIIVDSAANIPAELVKKYKIKVLSFINFVNGKEVTCFDPDLSPEEERQKGHEYYDAVRQGADVSALPYLKMHSAVPWKITKMCCISRLAKISAEISTPQDLPRRI